MVANVSLSQVKQNWNNLTTQDNAQNYGKPADTNFVFSNDQRMLNQIRMEWGSDKISVNDLKTKGMDFQLSILDFNQDGYIDAAEMGALFKFANVNNDDQTNDLEYANAMKLLTGEENKTNQSATTPTNNQDDINKSFDIKNLKNDIKNFEKDIKRAYDTGINPVTEELSYRKASGEKKNKKCLNLSDSELKARLENYQSFVDRDKAIIERYTKQIESLGGTVNISLLA
ncbi:MAG: hypothetical protein PHC34_03410 [Candidatus Gastranaerophilales bacterium]|nr:hypothetical protein [Candidatus Gastranaerophilales bacterium]